MDHNQSSMLLKNTEAYNIRLFMGKMKQKRTSEQVSSGISDTLML